MTDNRTPEEIDREVREALAIALNEKKLRIAVRLWDRRLLIIYVLLIALLTAIGQGYDSLTAACDATKSNAVTLNRTLDRIGQSVRMNPNYTAQEREERAQVYAELKQQVPTCPPGIPGW